MKKRTAIISIVAVVLLALAAVAVAVYRHQRVHVAEAVRVNIPQGSTYEALLDSLDANGCIADRTVFDAAARLRGLDKHVRGGSYLLQPGMSLAVMIQKLYNGNQDPIMLVINKQRTVRNLCDYLGSKLDLDADTLMALLTDDKVTADLGCTPATVFLLFPQNTYEVYWNISPERLLERMKRESDRFWTTSRLNKCHDLGLTPAQVLTLASIVDEETNNNAEKATVASVYLNRLRRGMPLQADPTVRYAVSDFTLRRILNAHTAVKSPYNTYLNPGLPPGPICIPQPSSIDAVLANLHTNYLYFCAKEDFSGSHNFAATLAEHQANAARYHRALNARKIK